MSDTDGEAENMPEDSEGATSTDYETETASEFLDEEEEGSIYDSEDFISGPGISENGTLNLDILEFDFSYGYDCLKYFNLCVLDEEIIVFSSGNFINFFNVKTKEIEFRRSALGGGIGHIRKNPNPEFPYFAVAECGKNPIIILYMWPTLEIICVLKGGATKTYTNMDFNPDGDLLVSQSGDPDYLITIWDWQHHTILLRTKSNVNDVLRVKFSPYISGQLTTCGASHIKFWKMASTFTGLKLKGELGRFGKTEYSDIIGVLPMPDSKVVSGCEWGNILVWDDGLITFEVFRSLRRKCHEGPIVQFYYLDGELWTVSMDGHIKVWWFEKIDQADPPDDDRVILVDPTYDFYTPGIKLISVEKRKPDPADTFWYGQDGNGGIWLIDLNTEEDPKPSERLYTCHGGEVRGLTACPFGPYIATLGELGKFIIIDYINRKKIFSYSFPANGVCLFWLPLHIDATGEIILAGFEDGQVRVCCVQIPEGFDSEKDEITFTIAQVIKPHNQKIVTMSNNPLGTLLVTAGQDSTIFIFKMNIENHNKLLTPIGFFRTMDIVTCITWQPRKDNEILLGCAHGQMIQIELPDKEQDYTNVSFQLYLETKQNCFTSHKSQIKRDLKIAEIEERKAKKVAKKRIEMEQIKKDNPGLEIDEEIFLADSDTEEELEPLYMPEVPNRIIWLKYTEKNTIWLSMAGYDAGYAYEYRIDQKDKAPLNFRLVDGADDMEISTYIYTSNQEYLIFAMENGSIRVNKRNPNDYMDLTDYFTISMHDNQRGFIPKLSFSYDEKYLFSCGYDGNIFAYKFKPQNYAYPYTYHRRLRYHVCSSVPDIETTEKLSLEGVKMKAEDDRIQKLANEHKKHVRDVIKTLKDKYKKLLNRNLKLLPSQIISREELEPEKRAADYVEQLFLEKIEIINSKLAYDVEKSRVQVTKLQNYFTSPCDRHPNVVQGINNPDCAIMTVRQRKMPPIFNEMKKLCEFKLQEEQDKGKPPERAAAVQKTMISKMEKTESPLEFFLLSLSPSVIELRLGPRLTRILAKYRKRKDKWKIRAKEWDEFMARKPIPGKNHPDDEKFLTEAKSSLGDYKLKESGNYKVPHDKRETTVKHYKKLLETRERQYKLRHSFIQKVFDIRDYKYDLIEKLKEKQKKIDMINRELPEEHRKNGPPIPTYDPDEYPEEKLKVKVVLPDNNLEPEEPEIPVIEFIEKPTGDILEKQLLAKKQYPKYRDGFFVSSTANAVVLGVADLSFQELVDFPENIDTPFESCLKANRINRLLFYQTLTIFEMQEMIDYFNNWIYEARKVRLPILIGGNFIDIFIVCVNEELQILKSCEEQEDKLSHMVNSKLVLVHDMADSLDSLKLDKENHETKLENFKIEESKIQEKFRVAVENNKFYEFLKKVFKKKFKPPKLRVDDESSSSSSSSSEESEYEDDTGSVDSKDFGFIKQDLNICPKGCEAALFNLTVDLRSKRHEIEQNEKEELRVLDLCKKDIEIVTKKLANLNRIYDDCQEKLEEFRREKQQKLNTVRCTVVLNLDQIYGFNPESSDISDFLVFSRTTLSDLYRRVRALHYESLDQQGKHDTYLAHLIRMKKDIIYMKRKVRFLKNEMIKLLKIKFGKTVDINELEMAIIQKSFQKNYVNELEEVMLKKLVYELRVKMADVRGLYINELELWQRKIVGCQFDLAKAIKDNTKRLALLTVISKEKKELARFVDSQNRRRERVELTQSIHTDFMNDLTKLENIIEEQNRTLQELKEEIKLLKTKGMAPEVLKRKERMAEYERARAEHEAKAEHEETARKWIDYDEYVSEPETEDEFEEDIAEVKEPIKRDITIPGYYSAETEDLVRDLVEDIMRDVDKSLVKRSTEAMVHDILSGIVRCHSMEAIVKEIVENFPSGMELSEDQRGSIDLVAEKLMSIQEVQIGEQDVLPCVREILEETLSEVLCHDPHYLIPTVLEKLLETLPVDAIASEEALDEIALKIKESSRDLKLDKNKLLSSLGKLPEGERAELVDIINSILERVYGEGIDYLYVIN